MAQLAQQSKYEVLLREAVQLRKKHESRAKDFVPQLYAILVEKEGMMPKDAAGRIYKDLAGVWQKDTIRRLLPAEAKDQSARERQALSRLHLVNNAGLILQTGDPSNGKGRSVAYLERENAKLAKKVETLQQEKRMLLEKTMRLERMLTEHSSRNGERKTKESEEVVVMPPHLFMKAFTLMRSSTKPLALKIAAEEVVDVDKISM